jgi:AcrR family transcriptional regulator
MSLSDELTDPESGAVVSSATGRPLTKRGEATRRRLLEAAEAVFAEQGYHEASIVKMTERAGIGLGTFYLYFDSKQSIFEDLVIDLNRRVRHSMSESMAGASSRLEAERAGFAGFFRFTRSIPRCTAWCAKRSSSRPRSCDCTTRASWKGTRPDSVPRSSRAM